MPTPKARQRHSEYPRLRAPHQARSRDTLRRIVKATEKLLEEKTFDEISVTEITKRARSSVGSFYARFPDKEALLDHLDELYAQDVIDFAEGQTDPARWEGVGLAEIVEALVRFLVGFHRERPGLLRTLIVEARRSRGKTFRERTERMRTRIPGLLALVASRKEEIGHAEPDRAAALGFAMVLSTVREVILFPEAMILGEVPSDDELVRELTQAYLAYLAF